MPEIPDLSHWLPPLGPETSRPVPPMTLRHPTEADVATLDDRLQDWRENRADEFPGRVWFRHFASTSWLAESDPGGRPLGLLLGFTSPDRAGEGVIQALAVDPAYRRKGIGRTLLGRFEAASQAAGAVRATAICRPDDRTSMAFYAAMGYEIDTGPGTRSLYGVKAYPDWDGRGEDRVLMEHRLE